MRRTSLLTEASREPGGKAVMVTECALDHNPSTDLFSPMVWLGAAVTELAVRALAAVCVYEIAHWVGWLSYKLTSS